MTRHDFLLALQDMLQCACQLTEDSQLTGMEEWDSIAFMVVISFFDKHFARQITFADLKKCRTPADLVAIADGAIA